MISGMFYLAGSKSGSDQKNGEPGSGSVLNVTDPQHWLAPQQAAP